MAVKFGDSINLDDFQLLNFVVHNAAVAPASVTGGAMFWDTANNILKVYDTEGASWMNLVEGVASSTNGALVIWNGNAGKFLGDSGINIDAVGPLSASATSIATSAVVKSYVDGVTRLAGRGLLLTGNTLSVDIDAVATETTILNADKLMFNKATDGLIYTITLADLASIIGGSGVGGEAFKTWVLTADAGYTWGTTSLVAAVGDTIDIVAGTGIEIRTDATLKALRITSTVTPGTGGIADPGTSVDREILTWNGTTGDAVRVSTGASITSGGDMLVTGDVVAFAYGTPPPAVFDTFKTWHLAADSGYTWGSADIVAVDTDTIDFIAGANITLTTDPTAKAIRITASGGSGMVYPSVGIAVSTGAAWTTSIAAANISSLAGLTYASAAFVKMTGTNTFTLDTNTYSLSSHTHSVVYQPAHANLTSLAGLVYSSLAFIKLSGANTFTLDTNTYSLSSHNHSGVYQPVHANLTSLSGLTYVSTSFVKMTGASTFSLDTNTYSLSSHTHTNMVDYTGTPVNNQLAIFTDANTIEGSSNLTFDNSTFRLGLGHLTSGVANGATAIGFSLVTPAYSTTGAKLFSLINNTTAMLSVDKDGTLTASGDVIAYGTP